MTNQELLDQLCLTWYREQSADEAHEEIWGEPFDGYTVRISEIAQIIDKPDYSNPEEMVRRLLEVIQK